MLADNLSAEPFTPGGVAMRRHSRGSAAENFLWKSMLAAGNQGDGVAPTSPAVMKNWSERGEGSFTSSFQASNLIKFAFF